MIQVRPAFFKPKLTDAIITAELVQPIAGLQYMVWGFALDVGCEPHSFLIRAFLEALQAKRPESECVSFRSMQFQQLWILYLPGAPPLFRTLDSWCSDTGPETSHCRGTLGPERTAEPGASPSSSAGIFSRLNTELLHRTCRTSLSSPSALPT